MLDAANAQLATVRARPLLTSPDLPTPLSLSLCVETGRAVYAQRRRAHPHHGVREHGDGVGTSPRRPYTALLATERALCPATREVNSPPPTTPIAS